MLIWLASLHGKRERISLQNHAFSFRVKPPKLRPCIFINKGVPLNSFEKNKNFYAQFSFRYMSQKRSHFRISIKERVSLYFLFWSTLLAELVCFPLLSGEVLEKVV